MGGGGAPQRGAGGGLLARRLPGWAGGLVGLAAIIAAWSLLAVTPLAEGGAIPTPAAVMRQVVHDGWGFHVRNVGVTTLSALQGYLWGNLLAIALALLVLLVPVLESAAVQVAVVSYCIPLTAIGPIVFIVAGPGSRLPSVILAAMSVFFTTVVGCLLGLRAADRASLDLIAVYGGGRWAKLTKVQLIAALPQLVAALKIAAPAAFLGAIIGEYLGGIDTGLGPVITSAQTQLRSSQIWSLALVSGLVAGAGYALVGLAGRFVTPWSRGAKP
jgi:ABC-type nitrate/sulfonate/bicarbonate transport system permease component